MADGGFTFTQGLSPQQSSQGSGQAASGDVSDTIFKASNLIEDKKRESMRQYERAQTMMRDDLKTMHGFDTSVGGLGQFSGALNELAEDARNSIKNAKDPLEAQEIIANFREQYNMVKSREEMIADKSKIYNAAVTASGEELDGLNAGLDVNSEYVIPETSDVARAQQAWSNPYEGNIQIVDGRMMAVDSKDGQLKELFGTGQKLLLYTQILDGTQGTGVQIGRLSCTTITFYRQDEKKIERKWESGIDVKS